MKNKLKISEEHIVMIFLIILNILFFTVLYDILFPKLHEGTSSIVSLGPFAIIAADLLYISKVWKERK